MSKVHVTLKLERDITHILWGRRLGKERAQCVGDRIDGAV